METKEFHFADRSGASEPKIELIPPVVIPKEAMDAEIERLASLPAPANGRRESAVVNPLTGVGDGLAPGIEVSISVLKPGEKTAPVRHNASLVNFCIQGGGRTNVDGKEIRYSKYDVWTTPSWVIYEHENNTKELQVRLTYSNAPLLRKMKVYIVDENPLAEVKKTKKFKDEHAAAQSPFGTFPISDDGAQLMPYEKLISPDVVKHNPLHFPWGRVQQELDKLAALGKSYLGRRLYLLYNPNTKHT